MTLPQAGTWELLTRCRTFSQKRVAKYWNRTQKCCGVTTLGDIQILSGQGSDQPDLVGDALRRGLAQSLIAAP